MACCKQQDAAFLLVGINLHVASARCRRANKRNLASGQIPLAEKFAPSHAGATCINTSSFSQLPAVLC